jgi:radical SAM protein with 4Fe4S-binding SPASM domain
MQSPSFDRISYLTLEANSTCNLSCKSCTRSELESAGHRPLKNLTQIELHAILEQFKNSPIDTIKFIGLSEPMLHPGFHELCETIREYFPRSEIIIATNLMYSLSKSPFFKTVPFVDQIYLSIDGTEQVFEKIRTGASYRKLISSLDQIDGQLPPEIKAEKLFINFTLSDENIDEIEKIYALKSRYGLAGVRINLAQNWSSKKPFHFSFSSATLNKLKPYLNDLKGVGGWKYKDCFWPFSGVSINVYGEVRPCTVNTDVESLGNVFEQNIKEIFASDRYQAMRDALRANRSPAGCENCCYSYLSPTLSEIFSGVSGNDPRPRSNTESSKGERNIVPSHEAGNTPS